MKPQPRITCVIFDLFGVLAAFDDALVYDRVAQRCSNPAHAFGQLTDLVSDPDLICGRTSLQALHARLVREVGLHASLDEFVQLWLQPYSEP